MSTLPERPGEVRRDELINIPLWLLVLFIVLLVASYIIGFQGEAFFAEPLVYANNSFSVAIISICMILTLTGDWRTSLALGVILAEVNRNLYVLLFFVLGHVQNGSQPILVQTIFMSVAFMSIMMSIGVGRTPGLIMGSLAIIMYAIGAWLYPRRTSLGFFFIQYAVIVGGGCLVTNYFRTYMLRLMRMRQDTLRRLMALKESAERWGDEYQPFIAFGQNTAGLIHDFRGYVHVLTTNTQVQLLRLNRGKEVDADALVAIEKKLGELGDRINLVTFMTHQSDEATVEELPVLELVRSVQYPFTISREIRLNIELVPQVPDGLVLCSSRQHVLRILENLVRNSCEAIMEQLPKDSGSQAINFLAKVIVEAIPDSGGCTFVVVDTGPGIKTCIECASVQSCLDCPQFRIGKTTKSYGSGWGMVNVRERIKELGGNLSIESHAGVGSRITVWIPDRRDLLPVPKPDLFATAHQSPVPHGD